MKHTASRFTTTHAVLLNPNSRLIRTLRGRGFVSHQETNTTRQLFLGATQKQLHAAMIGLKCADGVKIAGFTDAQWSATPRAGQYKGQVSLTAHQLSVRGIVTTATNSSSIA